MRRFLSFFFVISVWASSHFVVYGQTGPAPKDDKLESLKKADPNLRIFHITEEYLKRTNLAVEVPLNPQDYIWKVKGTINGVEVFKDIVPLYAEPDGLLHIIDSIAIGQTVELTTFMIYRSRNFFEIPLQNTAKDATSRPATAWIDGNCLEYGGKKDQSASAENNNQMKK